MPLWQPDFLFEVVQQAACPARTGVRVAAHELGRSERLARRQAPGEVKGLDAGDDVQRVVALQLHRAQPVAAPGQRAEPDRAAMLRLRAARAHREPGVCLVAAQPAAAFEHELARTEWEPVQT